jgi:ferritin-like metal-binding protein YciE
MRQLVTMVDSFLRRVNVYNSKRYTPQEIKKHSDETEKQTNFLMDCLECANLAFDSPDVRKRIITRFEHIISEENKRLSNKSK